MNSQNNPFATQPKRPVTKATNFAEALREIGSSTLRQGTDFVKSTATQSVSHLTGGAPKPFSGDILPNQSVDIEQQMKQQQEQAKREQARQLQHREVTRSTDVFDRDKERTKQEIAALQAELKKLARELGKMGVDVQKAVDQEIVNPGTYHVSYFQKLRTFIIQLRQRVSESKNWLAISSQRKKQRNHYWGNVKKSGTKYMLSQERTMATQAG